VPPTPQTSSELNPQFLFPGSIGGDYQVQLSVSNVNGCSDSISGIITVFENYTLFIPNSFTPDGDEFNNEFKVLGYGIDPSKFSMKIFNRWGELIFESYDLDKGWQGKYGKDSFSALAGTYTYLIEYQFVNQEQSISKVGNINLIR
jgi:gliding motility-associated-like protein